MQTYQRDRRLTSVLRPAADREDISHGRLVIASRRASGWARRTNSLHQLCQCHAARGELAAVQVVWGKAAPAPQVLEFG